MVERPSAAMPLRAAAHPSDQEGVDSRVANAIRNVAPCRRLALVTTVPMDAAGRELVQRARPPRRADTGQGAHALRGRGDHLRGDGEPRRRAGRRPGRARRRSRRRGGHPLVQLPRVPRGALRRQPPRRHRHADQLAARRPRGALHPGALRRAGPGLRRSPAPTGRRGRHGRSRRHVRARISICAGRPTGLDEPRRSSAQLRRRSAPRRGGRRRRPPVDVHLGHHRAGPRASCSRTPIWPGRTWRTSSNSGSRVPTSGWPAARCTTSARST